MANAQRLEDAVSRPEVVRVGPGTYAVTIDGRREIVYVAGAGAARSAFCRGDVFAAVATTAIEAPRQTRRDATEALTAPMPAKVLEVLATPGASVRKGETLVILEAMKMELPLRASGDATVKAVHCREGELVQPDTVLIELS